MSLLLIVGKLKEKYGNDYFQSLQYSSVKVYTF
jgi:hypothetical protein